MYKYRLFLTYFLFLLCFLNCKKKETTTPQEATEIRVASDTITLPTLSGLKPALRLTKDAKELAANWEFYQNVSKILDSLGKGNLGKTRDYVTQLDKLYNNLEESEEASLNFTPEEILTQPIKARLAALETQIRVLQNAVSKNEPSAEEVTVSIVKSKNAFQDLNLQINERFALSIDEMIKAAKEMPDSLKTKKAKDPNLTKPKKIR